MAENRQPPTFIVEHLDPELGEWSALEYQSIAEESTKDGTRFCLSSVPHSLELPRALLDTPGFTLEHRGIEEMYAGTRERVCLLDPAADKELEPADAENFDMFLFGGILGTLGPSSTAS